MIRKVAKAAIAAKAIHSANKKRRMANNSNNSAPVNYTPIVLGVLAIFFYDKLFGKDPGDKRDDKIEADFENQDPALNPLGGKAYNITKDVKDKGFKIPTGMKPILGLTNAKIQSISKEIFAAVGVLYNDKSALQAAFKQIPSRAACAAVAQFYNEKYKRDLLYDLKNSTQEQAIMIYSYINKLPVALLVKK